MAPFGVLTAGPLLGLQQFAKEHIAGLCTWIALTCPITSHTHTLGLCFVTDHFLQCGRLALWAGQMFSRLRTPPFLAHSVSSLLPSFLEDLLRGNLSFRHFFKPKLNVTASRMVARDGDEPFVVCGVLKGLFLHYGFLKCTLVSSLYVFLTRKWTLVNQNILLGRVKILVIK